jgi:acyl dehydratase
VTVSVGDEVPELWRVVTTADVAAYAEAGGDRNPLHLDDAFARSVGFDGVIAHGMFTMGHMATAVTAWAGDDAVVERITAQFRAPVFMGEEIRAGGTVRAVDGDEVTVDGWVAVDRDGTVEWPIKKGVVVLRGLAGS